MEVSPMEKIAVCHVNTRFLRGGGPRNTLLTISGLSPEKYRITLVVGRDANLEQLESLPHVEVVQVPSMIRAVRPVKDLITLWKLFQLFRTRGFHVVHTHFAKAGILGRLAARMAGIPMIVHSIHGTTFPDTLHPIARWIYVMLERMAGRYTHLFVPVCDGLRDQYLQEGIGREEDYRVIHSGFDVGRFRKASESRERTRGEVLAELGIEPGSTVIGYVANLEARKGHTHTLQMMSELAGEFPKTLLLLAGEGADRGRLEEEISHLGLKSNVRLLGYRTDMDRIFCAMDIKVFTSLWEGLPQALLQAAVMGVPIVAFDVDCVGEVVHDEMNGYLIPAGDVAMLTKRVRDLIRSPRLRREMGQAGRRIVDDSWEIASMVFQTDTLYTELIQKRLGRVAVSADGFRPGVSLLQ